jgi:hypothetical protein
VELANAIDGLRGILGGQQSELEPERGDRLERPVVDVEREPREPALTGLDELAFPLVVPVEERVPLEDEREHRGRIGDLVQRLVQLGRPARTSAAAGRRQRRTGTATRPPASHGVPESTALAAARTVAGSTPSPQTWTEPFVPSAIQMETPRTGASVPSRRTIASAASRGDSAGSRGSARAREQSSCRASESSIPPTEATSAAKSFAASSAQRSEHASRESASAPDRIAARSPAMFPTVPTATGTGAWSGRGC